MCSVRKKEKKQIERKLSEENGIENDSVILSLGVWVHGNSLLDKEEYRKIWLRRR